MNIFDAVKEELNTRQVVESYGIHVRHNGMCCCPFHGDKNPSMKVDSKRFHCFGCREDGDVIQFAAKLFDLTRYEAAKKLSEDFGVSYDRWKPERDADGKPVKPKPRPKSPEQLYREEEHHFYRTISDYYHVLRDWKEMYKPADMEAEWDDRFVEALDQIALLEDVMDHFLAGSREERKETFAQCSSIVQRAENRLKELEEQKEKPPSILKQLQMPVHSECANSGRKTVMCL